MFCCFRKHAYVDLASKMDLTKALTLNGETILDKPIRIEKAKIKSEDKVKRKVSAEDKKGNLTKCNSSVLHTQIQVQLLCFCCF